MTKIFKIFQSRTVWTIIVLFVINGVGGIKEFIPSDLIPLINGILSALAIYFRVSQRVDFKE